MYDIACFVAGNLTKCAAAAKCPDLLKAFCSAREPMTVQGVPPLCRNLPVDCNNIVLNEVCTSSEQSVRVSVAPMCAHVHEGGHMSTGDSMCASGADVLIFLHIPAVHPFPRVSVHMCSYHSVNTLSPPHVLQVEVDVLALAGLLHSDAHPTQFSHPRFAPSSPLSYTLIVGAVAIIAAASIGVAVKVVRQRRQERQEQVMEDPLL